MVTRIVLHATLDAALVLRDYCDGCDGKEIDSHPHDGKELASYPRDGKELASHPRFPVAVREPLQRARS